MSIVEEHGDVITPRHRFSGVSFRGDVWDLSHLEPFVMQREVDGALLNVVVMFSCHCFTHSWASDDRLLIPTDERFVDGFEHRVLSSERYRLSTLYLPAVIKNLDARLVRVAERQNFFITEATTSSGRPTMYAVFFEVTKSQRKKRLVLRVQTAYPLDSLPRRLQKAGKVNFHVLLKAINAGRQIRG